MFRYNDNVVGIQKKKKKTFDYIMVKKMYGSEATGLKLGYSHLLCEQIWKIVKVSEP